LIDPFGGSGTTGLAAKIAEVDATLIEIDPDVVRSASRRITDDAPLFAEGAA
jgi:DNA modification methylase